MLPYDFCFLFLYFCFLKFALKILNAPREQRTIPSLSQNSTL